MTDAVYPVLADRAGAHRVIRETVLDEIRAERLRQIAQYGFNETLDHGTGPNTRWLLPYTGDGAYDVEMALRSDYEEFEEETGKPTWLHLVREEIAEAFQEPAGPRLEEELIQVAALCVSWIENLRA